MKKVLVIEDHAKVIIFKNRKVRTPVSLEVTESELKVLEVAMHMAGVQKWKVTMTKIQEDEVIDYDFMEPEEVVIEELEELPKTILEKLMKNGDREK